MSRRHGRVPIVHAQTGGALHRAPQQFFEAPPARQRGGTYAAPTALAKKKSFFHTRIYAYAYRKAPTPKPRHFESKNRPVFSCSENARLTHPPRRAASQRPKEVSHVTFNQFCSTTAAPCCYSRLARRGQSGRRASRDRALSRAPRRFRVSKSIFRYHHICARASSSGRTTRSRRLLAAPSAPRALLERAKHRSCIDPSLFVIAQKFRSIKRSV
jgi:hypothetical protein